MKIISFIILHYMAIEETMQCIQSIKRMDNQEEIRIVVVDNASPNRSGEQLRKTYCEDEQIDVIINEKNEGFSRGNNIGCQYARKKWNPAFYVVTNNDIVFLQKDFCEKVKEEYKQSEFSVMGMDIYCEKKGIHQSPLAYRVPKLNEIKKTIILNSIMLKGLNVMLPVMKAYFNRIDSGGSNAMGYDKYCKNICPMGACMIFSRKYMDKRRTIFWPETDFYYEEFLLTLWCLNNNETIVYQPQIKALHNEGVSTRYVDKEYKKRIKFRMTNILKAAKIYEKELLSYK